MNVMTALPSIPWTTPALLGGVAAVLFTGERASRSIVTAIGRHRQRTRHERGWDRPLLNVIIILGLALGPVFFYDMFRTVTSLLGSSGFPDAWTVPAATEGAFVFLYLLGLYLRRKGKPKLWLRWAPYPFAAASLFLNVYDAHGHIAPMVGHAAVTVAFFLPVLAAEAAIDSMAFTSSDMAFHREMTDAMRYARDLLRDQKGIFWYWRVPPLLRRQAMRRRPRADVKMAIAEGAEGAGSAAWESPVDDWVTAGLTRREKVAEKVTTERTKVRVTAAQERRALEASAAPQPDASAEPQAERQASRQVTRPRENAGRVKVKRILTTSPDLPRAEVARRAGVSESTVDRVKREIAEGADVIAIGA